MSASDGMTLRDYFAAKVMQNLCASPDMNMLNDQIAAEAYRVADAMLVERAK